MIERSKSRESERAARWHIVAGFAWLLVSSAGVHAAWVTDGEARLDTRYDDNVTLSGTDEEGSMVTVANGQLELRNVTENSEMSAIAGVRFINYSESQAGTQDLNDEDVQFIDIRSRFEAERSTWGLRGSLRRDVTLATVGFIRDPLSSGGSSTGGTAGGVTDTPTTGPGGATTGNEAPGAGNPGIDASGGDPLGGGTLDAGTSDEQVRRYDATLNPYLEYLMSELTTLQLGYFFSSLHYDDATTTDLEDSQTNAVRLEARRRMSERDIGRIQLGAARMNPDVSSDSDALQMTAGWEHRFSERAGASLDAGANYRDRDNKTDTGFTFNLRAFRDTEVGSMFIEARRSLTPTAFGELAETDRLVLGMRRSLSDTVEVSATGDGYKTNDSQDNDRSYASFGPEIRWLFTPALSLGATYRYRWADRKGEPGGDASGNSIGVFISYRPEREIQSGSRR